MENGPLMDDLPIEDGDFRNCHVTVYQRLNQPNGEPTFDAVEAENLVTFGKPWRFQSEPGARATTFHMGFLSHDPQKIWFQY
jgi:hypothetical protein